MKTLFVTYLDGSAAKFSVGDDFQMPHAADLADARHLVYRNGPYDSSLALSMASVRSMYLLDEEKLQQEPEVMGEASEPPATLAEVDN